MKDLNNVGKIAAIMLETTFPKNIILKDGPS